MIPKIIHYCWFGGCEKSEEIKLYIDTWKNMEGYKVIEWNEENFDINSCEFISKAYKLRKWAFVSDYVRLKVLYEYGGIYLDTDVEIVKSFDPLLNNELFLGFIFDCSIGTAVIGSVKNNKTVKELLDLYESADIVVNNNKVRLDFKIEKSICICNNNDLFTTYFVNKFDKFKLNNKLQRVNEITIYPKEYFERRTYNRKINYSIHHCSGSWWKEDSVESKIKVRIKNLIKNTIIYDKYICKRKLKKLPYYNLYLKNKLT